MENNENRNPEESTSEYYDSTIKDLEDLQILNTQAGAQIALVLGYFADYIATNQAIQVLEDRISIRNTDYFNGEYVSENGEKEKFGLDEDEFKNKGVDADKTAYLAAILELLGQTVVTYLDGIKLQRFNEHREDRDFLIAKTANEEIFAGAVFGEISFIYNLQGVRLLYEISNQDELDD